MIGKGAWLTYATRLLGLILAIGVCTALLQVTGLGCLVKLVGVRECPVCGMTRASLSFLQGDIDMVLKYNPLAPLCWIALLLIPLRREDLSRKSWIAVNVILSLIGMAFGIRWLLISL